MSKCRQTDFITHLSCNDLILFMKIILTTKESFLCWCESPLFQWYFACCWSNALRTAIRWILLEWFWTQCTSRLNARLERTSSHFSSGCCWASAVNMRLQLARAFNLRHLRGNCLLGKFANVDQPTNRSFSFGLNFKVWNISLSMAAWLCIIRPEELGVSV